jgi:hypothetical protein
MGLVALLKKHRKSHIEQACAQAQEHSGSTNPSLRHIRQHLPTPHQPPSQAPTTSSTTSNPHIRELFVYDQFVQTQTNNTKPTQGSQHQAQPQNQNQQP